MTAPAVLKHFKTAVLAGTAAAMTAVAAPALAQTGTESKPGGVEHRPSTPPPPAAATMDAAPLLRAKPTVTPPVLPTPATTTVVPKTPPPPAATQPAGADAGKAPAVAPKKVAPPPAAAPAPPPAAMPRAYRMPEASGAVPERSMDAPSSIRGDETRPGGVERSPSEEKRAP